MYDTSLFYRRNLDLFPPTSVLETDFFPLKIQLRPPRILFRGVENPWRGRCSSTGRRLSPTASSTTTISSSSGRAAAAYAVLAPPPLSELRLVISNSTHLLSNLCLLFAVTPRYPRTAPSPPRRVIDTVCSRSVPHRSLLPWAAGGGWHPLTAAARPLTHPAQLF